MSVKTLRIKRAVTVAALMFAGVAWGQEMCMIRSKGQSCSFEPFLVTQGRPNVYNCAALSNYKTFDGTCQNGKIEGIAIFKPTNGEAYILGQFIEGRIESPFGSFLDWGTVARQKEDLGAGCINFKRGLPLQAWPQCSALAARFGDRVFQHQTVEEVRSGRLSASDFAWNAVAQTSAPAAQSLRDDPKTVGRGARGG